MNWNRVYDLVKKIPRGRVMTYGQVAKALRLAGGARTAGRAMAGCPSGQGVPWHRVVRSDGSAPIGARQLELLRQEGVPVRGDRVDLDRARLSPDRQPPTTLAN